MQDLSTDLIGHRLIVMRLASRDSSRDLPDGICLDTAESWSMEVCT